MSFEKLLSRSVLIKELLNNFGLKLNHWYILQYKSKRWQNCTHQTANAGNCSYPSVVLYYDDLLVTIQAHEDLDVTVFGRWFAILVEHFLWEVSCLPMLRVVPLSRVEAFVVWTATEEHIGRRYMIWRIIQISLRVNELLQRVWKIAGFYVWVPEEDLDLVAPLVKKLRELFFACALNPCRIKVVTLAESDLSIVELVTEKITFHLKLI